MAFCISHTAVKTLLETYMCISSKDDVWRWNSRSLYRSHPSMCCFFLQSQLPCVSFHSIAARHRSVAAIQLWAALAGLVHVQIQQLPLYITNLFLNFQKLWVVDAERFSAGHHLLILTCCPVLLKAKGVHSLMQTLGMGYSYDYISIQFLHSNVPLAVRRQVR